jgi:hypothetical protein
MILRQYRGVLLRRPRGERSWSYRPLLEQLETRVLPSLDFSGGFGGAAAALTTNGSANLNGSVLQLTQGQMGQDGSAFSSVKQDITSFHTAFSFQLTNANADGFTFCIQGGASTALGPAGGGLGYGPDHTGGTGGIANSVAVKFDLFNNQGEGSDSTGLFTNGAAPTNVASVDLTASGLDLHSGQIFKVGMTYDGTTLKVILLDSSGHSNTQNYTVNIPTTVGGSTAYVGFTGATGGLTAVQNILTWTYKEGPATPPLAPLVTAVGGPGHVVLRWTPSVGADSYNIYRATTPNGEGTTPLQTGINGTAFTDTNVVAGTYYYRVTGVGIAGEGPMSIEVSAAPTAGLDFAAGFAGAGSMLTTNGSAMISADPVLQLTNGQMGQAGSVFSNVKQTITTFDTAFSFHLINAIADGFTFCIQGNASTALGPAGGGLGYGPDHTGGTGGIANSVAVKFDLFNNQGEGIDSTGLFTNGAAPTNVGSVDLGPSGLNLHSGDIFNAAMTYDGTKLKVVLTDTNTGKSNTQTYTVDIPTTVGGPTAFVGFTGATGGLTATQDILNWTFGKVGTATIVSSSPNPSVLGQAVTFTASVSAVGSAATTPTGSVDFKEGGTDLTPGGVTLNGAAQATFTISSLAVGSHTITATYGGSTSFLSSTGDDTASPQVVNKASTSTAVSSAPNPSVSGQLVTVTATVAPVAPGGGTPTGTVTFTVSDLVEMKPLNGSGQATFSFPFVGTGMLTITASYGGDMDFLTSMGNDSASPQVVNKASTTTTLTSAPNPSSSGTTVTFTATVAVVAPGTGTPSGKVNFTEGATTLAPSATLNGSGQATFTTSTLSAGSHTITASYLGDARPGFDSFLTSTGDDSAAPQVVT